MKKGVAILLIVAALLLGYLGIRGLDDSSQSVELGDAKITATDEDDQSMSYVYLAAGVLLLIGGVYMLMKGERRV